MKKTKLQIVLFMACVFACSCLNAQTDKSKVHSPAAEAPKTTAPYSINETRPAPNGTKPVAVQPKQPVKREPGKVTYHATPNRQGHVVQTTNSHSDEAKSAPMGK